MAVTVCRKVSFRQFQVDTFQAEEGRVCAGRMHADELDIDVTLVRRLLAGQFPQWADLAVEPVSSAGTDNALFRLGANMAVRLPRIHWAVAQVAKEHQWLPRIAPLLPLAVPVPLAKGAPAEGYPWHWSVYRWLKGENVTFEYIADSYQAAKDLAHFVSALQRIDPAGGPPPGAHNAYRGAPQATRDARVRDAIAALAGAIDTEAATALWEEALESPAWSGSPVWVHGDLSIGNLLVQQGQLIAVIDFGCLGVGDPACDVMAAWTLFSAETRTVFRTALSVDDATWMRARGWALSVALIALPYYANTNPILVSISRRTIREVLVDYRGAV